MLTEFAGKNYEERQDLLHWVDLRLYFEYPTHGRAYLDSRLQRKTILLAPIRPAMQLWKLLSVKQPTSLPQLMTVA